MMKNKKIISLSFLMLFCLTACSTLPKTSQNFSHQIVQSKNIPVHVWEKRPLLSRQPIRFYIGEYGNPNPENPVDLIMAQKDNFDNIVVLTRPCQYNKTHKICQNSEIWTTQQYHPELINELKEIVLSYVRYYKAPKIEFVAYGNGAPVALNLASKMANVSKIVTIAGVLDINAYAQQNNLPAFKNAQNPADHLSLITRIPQIHFIGSDDRVVTKTMTENFVKNLPNPRSAVVKVVSETNHYNWDDVDLSY